MNLKPHLQSNFNSPSIRGRGRCRRSVSAFTLIELLVVIGILGILTILVVQTYSDAKSNSIDAQVRASLSSLNQAAGRAYLIGDSGRPGLDYTNNLGGAVQWYIDNGYISVADFDPSVLSYLQISPPVNGEQSAIWQRKP